MLLATVLLLAASACDKRGEGTGEAAPAVLAPGGQAKVTVGEHGFAPSSFEVTKGPAGSSASLTFLRTTDQTCAKEVVFPELSLQKELPLGQPVTVAVPTDAARTLTFQCGMAMYKGALTIH
jgi:plastocyanin domain-containing protein